MYSISTDQFVRRKVRWMLPPSLVNRVLVNGKPVHFGLTPGVDCVVLEFATGEMKSSTIRIAYAPVGCRVDHAGSVAEGDELNLSVTGATIERVDDRCGVLASTKVLSPGRLTARVRTGLLAPYMGSGGWGR